MNEEQKKYIFKVILLGDSQVGKTSLFNYLSGIKYSPNYIATIGIDNVIKSYDITKDEKNYKVELKIYDTSGQERYKSISNSYYKKVNAAIFMYDVTNKTSFKNINNWILELKNKSYSKNMICAILGNKIDKIGEFDELADEKKIYQSEIADEEINDLKEKLIDDDFNVDFEKISAKFGTNIDNFMVKFSEKILDNKLNHIDDKNNDNNDIRSSRVIIVKNAKKKNESFCCLFRKKNK